MMNPWDDPYSAQLDPALVNRLRPMRRQQPQQAAPQSPLDPGLMGQLGRPSGPPLQGGTGTMPVLDPSPWNPPAPWDGGGHFPGTPSPRPQIPEGTTPMGPTAPPLGPWDGGGHFPGTPSPGKDVLPFGDPSMPGPTPWESGGHFPSPTGRPSKDKPDVPYADPIDNFPPGQDDPFGGSPRRRTPSGNGGW